MRVTREITLQNWWVAKRKALTKRMTGPRVWRWWGDSRSVERTGKQVSGSGNTCRENIQNEGETGRTAGKLGVFFSLVIRKKRAVIARLRLNRFRSELQEPHPSKKGPQVWQTCWSCSHSILGFYVEKGYANRAFDRWGFVPCDWLSYHVVHCVRTPKRTSLTAPLRSALLKWDKFPQAEEGSYFIQQLSDWPRVPSHFLS